MDRSGPLGLIVGLVGFLATAAVGAGLYMFLVTPANARFDKTVRRSEAKAGQASKAEVEARKQADRQDGLERDVARLRQTIDRAKLDTGPSKTKKGDNKAEYDLRQVIATRHDAKAIRSYLRRKGEEASAAIKRVAFGKPIKRGPLNRMKVEVTASGSYAQLTEWLLAIATRAGVKLEIRELEITRREQPLSPFYDWEKDRLDAKVVFRHWALDPDPIGKVPFFKRSEIDNADWKTLRGSFRAYVVAGLAGKRDPFRPKMRRYFDAAVDLKKDETPAPAEQPAPDETTPTPDAPPAAVEPEAAPVSPIVAHPTDQYEVLHIDLSDPDKPVAILIGPDSTSHKVGLDAAIGNAKGQIIEITKKGVLVAEPDKDEGILLREKN